MARFKNITQIGDNFNNRSGLDEKLATGCFLSN